MRTLIVAAMLGTMPMPATAAIQCGSVQEMAEQLGQVFGEAVFASGVSSNQSVKFLGNPRTGTWTMVVIRPNGNACIIASGDGLEVKNIALTQGASY